MSKKITVTAKNPIPQIKTVVTKREWKVWAYARFFNPFKKRLIGVIVPTCWILPAFGIEVDRSEVTFQGLKVRFEWLGFMSYVEIRVLKWVRAELGEETEEELNKRLNG